MAKAGTPRFFNDRAKDDWVRSQLPPVPAGAAVREAHYPRFLRDMCEKLDLESRTVWDHYGCGYASYVDGWFYRETAEFRRPPYADGGHHFTGVYAQLCRLGPYFVMGEGAKSWTKSGGGSYLPSFAMLDVFPTPAVASLAGKIARHLAHHGLVRLGKSDLAIQLPPGYDIDTNISDGPLRLYDALFFWFD